MSYVFSPSRAAFYAASLRAAYDKADAWPNDAVAVSDDDWLSFQSGQPDGKILGSVGDAPAWVSTPVPERPSTITSTAFINRFSPTELGMLAGSPATLLLLITCAAAGRIDLNDADVQAGVNGLVPSVLTSERATAVLTP